VYRYYVLLFILAIVFFIGSFMSLGYKLQASSQASPFSNTGSNSSQEPNNNNNINAREEKDVTHTVRIVRGSGEKQGQVPEPFTPSSLSIHAGDTVKWINDDSVPHSVTSLLFKSDELLPFSNYSSRTFEFKFEHPGTYVYVDRLYPYMAGIILVDVTQTQRQLVSVTGEFIDVKIEIPRNAAYSNVYGPYFIPAYSLVPIGTNVTWTNQDYVAHTATSADGSFDTEAIIPGQSKTVKLNHSAGTISYYCEIHPWMLGTVTVSK